MISPHLVAVGAALLAMAAVDASAIAAQSGLEGVERLTRLGRTEEAREVLLDWWEDDRGDANRRELQRGLWLRGRLTVDPVQAELDFRRLAVLYPSGQFTPDAIFRLAQSSYAMGDEQEARGYVATLVRDYPRSEAREDAEAWLENAGPLPPPGDTPTPMRAGSPTDVDRTDPAADPTANERAPGDPPADDPAEEPGSAIDEPAVNYYVQLGAFGEEERAMGLYEQVRDRGIDVRVVHVEGSRFTHVRVGRFAERAAAVDLLEELTEQGINAALVRDDRPERPIGE